MRFSKRTEWNTEATELSLAYRQRIADGRPIADLTISNPTRCGLTYAEKILQPLNDSAVLEYDPNPKGRFRSRQAVVDYYADHGANIGADQVLLTASTSEVYSYLFKLLCNPGETILAPQPSYPLFDFLADAEVVILTSAPLVYDLGWQLDIEGVRRAITPATRAVVLVHPNNPTGHFTKQEEAIQLAELCLEYGLALIVDEVFLDYPLDDNVGISFAVENLGVLTFIVSGISKIAALPQMKLAWLVVIGPGSAEALERLEVLADTYLSVSAPAQFALPNWLAERAAIQTQIRQRVSWNLSELDRQLTLIPLEDRLISRLQVEAGWYAILRIPSLQPDDATALQLLQKGVWVHPGHFFGMGESGWLVVSLLGRPEEFSRGLSLILEYRVGNQESYRCA